MSDYRRYFVPGGTYFFTIVTYLRRPLFAKPQNVQQLRDAIGAVMKDQPFEINAAVILPDHMHFIWSLPRGDVEYSKRIGRMKVEFTKTLRGSGGGLGGDGGDLGGGQCPPYVVSASRRKRRESDVWQRRFWEHTIRDEEEFEGYFNYVHYNPVKHRHVSCPHLWEASSFHRWVEKGVYELHWGCCCAGRDPGKFNFSAFENKTGEP